MACTPCVRTLGANEGRGGVEPLALISGISSTALLVCCLAGGVYFAGEPCRLRTVRPDRRGLGWGKRKADRPTGSVTFPAGPDPVRLR